MKIISDGLDESYTRMYVEKPLIRCLDEEMRGKE